MSATEISHGHVAVANHNPSESESESEPEPESEPEADLLQPTVAPSRTMVKRVEHGLEGVIFNSRWLQAPMYLGLIVALVLYGYRFGIEVFDLCSGLRTIQEEELMISVLSLVDITMIANLIVMVVIGGYATFVSRINVNTHEDNPSWLEHIGPSTLKIKLSTALVSISGIHLLKAFINIKQMDHDAIRWMVIIHVVFLGSAFILSLSERVLHPPASSHHQ